MLGASLVDKLGRRTLFIISNTGMLISEAWTGIQFTLRLTGSIGFVGWTLTTALFNRLQSEKGREAAAKGASRISVLLAREHGLMFGHAATIPSIFLFYFFYDIAYAPLLVAYVVEILPFKIRSRGLAVMVSVLPPFPSSIYRGGAQAIDSPISDSYRTRPYVSFSRSTSL